MKTKKMQMEHFFPKFRWRPKKRSLSKIEHFFPQIQVMNKKKRSSSKIEHIFPQFSLRSTPIQIIGRDTAKLLGGIYSPLFRHPCLHYLVVMKQELSKKAKLSIFKAVFVPILTNGYESWQWWASYFVKVTELQLLGKKVTKLQLPF